MLYAENFDLKNVHTQVNPGRLCELLDAVKFMTLMKSNFCMKGSLEASVLVMKDH